MCLSGYYNQALEKNMTMGTSTENVLKCRNNVNNVNINISVYLAINYPFIHLTIKA